MLRAKRAFITRASQGQRHFLLALNLSSLVGVCLDVTQSSDVKVHYGFPGNRLQSMTKLRLFMKRGFSYEEQCLRPVNHHPISQANKREQQTQQQWIQQVAGNPRWERITNKTPQDRERRLEIQGEQRHGEGKRCQLNTEDVKRQQQNTTITLQTKPTKRGNTDCRCFSKMRSSVPTKVSSSSSSSSSLLCGQ